MEIGIEIWNEHGEGLEDMKGRDEGLETKEKEENKVITRLQKLLRKRMN